MNHCTVKRKLLIIRLVIESIGLLVVRVLLTRMMDHVARIPYAKRVFSYAHTRVDCVAYTRDTDTSWRQLMQTQACRYICTAKGKEILLITQASGFHIRWEALQDRYPIPPPCHFNRTLPKSDTMNTMRTIESSSR